MRQPEPMRAEISLDQDRDLTLILDPTVSPRHVDILNLALTCSAPTRRSAWS